jgi:hypothetical protein
MTGQMDRGAGPRSLSEIVNNGSSQGGSFTYDETTLRGLIKQWLDLAEHYDGSRQRVNLGAVDGPGLDFASKDLATAANTSGTAYMTYLAQNYEYCVKQAQLLQNTLDDYLGVEHQQVRDFLKTAEETGTEPPAPRSGV